MILYKLTWLALRLIWIVVVAQYDTSLSRLLDKLAPLKKDMFC